MSSPWVWGRAGNGLDCLARVRCICLDLLALALAFMFKRLYCELLRVRLLRVRLRNWLFEPSSERRRWLDLFSAFSGYSRTLAMHIREQSIAIWSSTAMFRGIEKSLNNITSAHRSGRAKWLTLA